MTDLYIDAAGTTRLMVGEAGNPLLAALGPARVRRASHVEPVGWLRRLAFRLVRALERDRPGPAGRLARWTRTWRGPWQADLTVSGGPVLGAFATRAGAIGAEVAWLERRALRPAD
jgi:hypothetical protein